MTQESRSGGTISSTGISGDDNPDNFGTRTGNKPGRPKGASRLNKADDKVLVKIADALVRDPGLRPTDSIRRQGVTLENDIRRLQRKWRKRKAELLETARLKYDSQLELGFFGELLRSFAYISDLADEFTDPAVKGAINQSLNRAVRVHTAYKKLGLYGDGSIDPDDIGQVNAALARFEARPHFNPKAFQSDVPKETSDKLTTSTWFYAMALSLHEMSLDAYEKEIAEGETPSLPIVKDKAAGNKS